MKQWQNPIIITLYHGSKGYIKEKKRKKKNEIAVAKHEATGGVKMCSRKVKKEYLLGYKMVENFFLTVTKSKHT